MNATGIGNVNGSGNTWFGFYADAILDDAEPTWENNVETGVSWYQVDESGTSNDPVLSITHSASAGGTVPTLLTLGVG